MHFYKQDGSSMHTIIGANGKERTTSIADARKLGLYPSVTTVMDVQAKPALIEWLQQELLEAAISRPFHPHEWDVTDWKKAMLMQMRVKGANAAKRGIEIHGKLDQFFSNNCTWDVNDPDIDYMVSAVKLIDEQFGLDGWVSEKSFAHESGFAGCVDLHHPDKHIIIDFKTKDKADLKGVKQYDDHKIQLAAYQCGLNMPSSTRRFNLFISTNKETPGQCNLVECTEFSRYLGMFSYLHAFWMLKNKYDPRKGVIK